MSILFYLIIFIVCWPILWAILYVVAGAFGIWFCRDKAIHSPIKITPVKFFFAMAKEFCCAVMVHYLRFISLFISYPIYRQQQVADELTVLVHGYVDCPLSWWWFKKEMRRQGVENFATVTLRPVFGGIDKIATNLQQDLQPIIEKSGAKKIHLIGHSMGGIVSSYYYHHLADKDKIHSLVTIGSPWEGTVMTIFAWGENVNQMNHGSEFTKKLHDSVKGAEGKMLYISSVIDNVIIPWQSAFASTEPKSSMTTTDGHIALLYSQDIVEKVSAFMKRSG